MFASDLPPTGSHYPRSLEYGSTGLLVPVIACTCRGHMTA